jgi:hypothetical protein
VVSSQFWNNGTATAAGAVTWGSGTAGISGPVSAANSLVGSTASDQVGGLLGVTALSNGNYVVSSPDWTNGTATSAGAVTWGSGTAGVRGTVTAANSLVGSTASDQVGNYGVTPLSNGNFVVSSTDWANGAATNAGAVTWGSGTAGISGPVSAANSLVGTTAGDQVGSSFVTELSSGNYVVSSPHWSNGTAVASGAVTWGSGTAGVTGIISTRNSALGSVTDSALGTVVPDDVNGTFLSPFVSDGGGRVRVGSQATGFAAAQTITSQTNQSTGKTPTSTPTPTLTPTSTPTPTPTPTLPQVYVITGASSRKGLTSFTVRFNEPVNSNSASSPGLYHVFGAVTKLVKRHKTTLFTKALAMGSVSPDSTSTSHTVTINLARPFKGHVQVMVQGTITAGNGASNSVHYTQDL